MDHPTIDTDNIAERYVTGRLSPEEAARFEEHYLDCPSCCTRVEAAERLQRGFRRLAEEAAVRAPGDSRSTSWSRSPRLALAAAALLAVALVPAWLEHQQSQRLRSDLATAREDLARTQAEKGSTDRLKGELEQTRRDLAAEAEKREALAREMAADRQPQANLPVVPLTSVRGGSSGGPVRTLKLPERPGWVALWVEPGDADFPAYRATLRTEQGAVVFEASGLALNDLGALLVTVHSTSLSPGAYRLDLEGLPAAGAPVSVGRFPLRID
jgi:putative zinc finger protein